MVTTEIVIYKSSEFLQEVWWKVSDDGIKTKDFRWLDLSDEDRNLDADCKLLVAGQGIEVFTFVKKIDEVIIAKDVYRRRRHFHIDAVRKINN